MIKKFLKTCITFIIHPMISIKLIMDGCIDFYVGPHITINGRSGLRGFRCRNHIYIGSNARFLFVKEYAGRSYTPQIEIGENVCIGNRFSALSAAAIIIEDDCLIASDVMITSENHGLNVEDARSYSLTPLEAKEVCIGKGCWLGEKVCIMPGVTLGERTIVAAGAVVTKSFPAYSMIGGIPARLLKTYNFDTHSWERV